MFTGKVQTTSARAPVGCCRCPRCGQMAARVGGEGEIREISKRRRGCRLDPRFLLTTYGRVENGNKFNKKRPRTL